MQWTGVHRNHRTKKIFMDVISPQFTKLFQKKEFQSTGSWNDGAFTETHKNLTFAKVHPLFNKYIFYKQHQAQTGKKSGKN